MKSLLRFRSEGSHRGCPIEQLREYTRERRVRSKNNNIIEGTTDIHQSPINLSRLTRTCVNQPTEHTVQYPTKEKHINKRGAPGRPVRLKKHIIQTLKKKILF